MPKLCRYNNPQPSRIGLRNRLCTNRAGTADLFPKGQGATILGPFLVPHPSFSIKFFECTLGSVCQVRHANRLRSGGRPAEDACIPGCFDQGGFPTGYKTILLSSVDHAESNPAIADASLDQSQSLGDDHQTCGMIVKQVKSVRQRCRVGIAQETNKLYNPPRRTCFSRQSHTFCKVHTGRATEKAKKTGSRFVIVCCRKRVQNLETVVRPVITGRKAIN